MSTIVLNPNNTPDWRTQALLGFIGPVIGDWIKSEREKEINRKNNAAIYEAAKSLDLGGNDYASLPPSMSNNNGGLLGGSNNGWQNTFRNTSDNPLATFDANTADIAPNPNPNVAASLAQPQHRIPTPAEFMQAMANVVGSQPRRFGLVNLKNLQELAAPIMAAYENSRNEQRRNEVADAYANADNPLAQRDTIMRAYINGLVPHELVTDATHNYEYENPHLIPGAYDAGGENYFYNYNPRTGQYNFSTQVNKSLSPQQVQAGEQWDKQFGETVKNNDREYGLRVRQQDWNEEQARWIRENPELKHVVGEDGRLWGVDPRTGKATPALTPDGEPIYVNPQQNGSTGTTSYDKEFFSNRERQKTELNKRRRELEKARREAYSDEEKQKYTQEIEKIDADINRVQKEIDDRLQYSQNYQNGDAVRYRMPNGQGITYSTIAEWERQIQSGETANFGGKLVKTVDELHARLRELGAVDEGASVSKYRRNPTNNNNSSADVTPQNIQSAPSDSTNNTDNTEFEPVDVDSANQGIAFRNPSNGKTITKEQFYEDIKREREKEIFHYGKSPEQTFFDDERIIEQVVENYKSQGYKDIRLANSPNRNNTSVAQSNTSTGVGNTPFLTAEEKERADTQGSTGSNIARVPEKQNEAVLNGNNPPTNNYKGEEYNSEVMWTHPNGSSITKSEYNNRLKVSGMENLDYDAWLEAQGYRRADNSNSPAPVGTDYVNGTTPQHNQAQIDYLNGNDVRNGTNFMGEDLPGLMPHGAMAASLTPMGLSRTLNNSNNSNVQDYLQNNEPPAYNPYDINADIGQPYNENDVYEQGFEYDDDASNGIVTPEVKNKGYNVLPLADLSNHAPKPADYGYYLPPVGQKGLNHIRPMPPIGQTYPDIPDTPAQSNTTQDFSPQSSPKQSMQPQNNNQQNRYKGIRIPKRETRRPGKIKPNTSYQDLKPIVDDAARNNRLEPELVRAIIQIESRWDSNARSHVGAKGLMQLMPGTAREVGIRDAYDVAQNINGGSKYIARMIKMFNGNIAHALMAYNWGPGNMRKALKSRKSIPPQVRKYARDILNIYNSLKRK